MGPQFFHIQTFSRKPNPKSQSVDQVLGEADRNPKFSGHVGKTQPPALLYGMKISSLADAHAAMIAGAATEVTLADGSKRQRAIRQDRHTLGTFIASYPVEYSAMKDNAEELALYEEWKRLNIEYLRQRFGDQLKTVIEHTDETYGHIHAYVLPDDRADVDARELNPAYVAKRKSLAEATADKLSPGEALKRSNKAYKEAARHLGDDYYREVSAPAGLTRYGPRRRRLPRSEWYAETHATREASNVIRRQRQAEAAQEVQDARERAIEATREVTALKAELLPLQTALKALDTWRASMSVGPTDDDRQEARHWLAAPSVPPAKALHRNLAVIALINPQASREVQYEYGIDVTTPAATARALGEVPQERLQKIPYLLRHAEELRRAMSGGIEQVTSAFQSMIAKYIPDAIEVVATAIWRGRSKMPDEAKPVAEMPEEVRQRLRDAPILPTQSL